METHLAPDIADTPAGQKAQAILRSCVHCGFCTATCPTYLLTGDELDGPRGRIYLIKQMLETDQASDKTRHHLDRCLTCRACETTCPSGVRYVELLELGRHLAARKAPRPLFRRLQTQVLKSLLPWPKRLQPLVCAARLLKPLLPPASRHQLGDPARPVASQKAFSRQVILFRGCAQSVLAGSINQAATRVLEKLGVGVVEAEGERCCGAVNHHLDDAERARQLARANIDSWSRALEAGAEALLVTSSACLLEIREYPRLLEGDDHYLARFQTIAKRCLELSEYLAAQPTRLRASETAPVIAFQSPCTLQHGLKAAGQVEQLLRNMGFVVREPRDAHLCCGSAGTYSIFQPELSHQLRNNKLQHLRNSGAEVIATANIGCLLHLRAVSAQPVKHWVEWVARYAHTKSPAE